MAVHGDLSTMSLCDLLQWASVNRKTGVLELERNRICRRIEFRNGWIGACSSDDPPSRLGQFLLARGKITRERLSEALARQQSSGENLGLILLDMGTLNQKELAAQIAAKAEETIQGLFDWEDAVFRFHDGATLEPNQIEVSLSVDDILLKGIQHHDELKRIREVFPSSGVVLKRTGRPVPKELLGPNMARRIFESIDGEKTLAELLLHVHGSEFLVIKLLHTLYCGGLVMIKEARPVGPNASTLLDPPSIVKRASADDWEKFGPNEFQNLDLDPAEREPARRLQGGDAPRASVSELDAEVEVARRLMQRDEHEAALELLNASYRAHPDESHLGRLIAKAEAAYIESAQRHGLSYDRVPVPARSDDGSLPQGLGPQESFLISLLDGHADIRTVLWLAPLREVDVLRSLRQLQDRGLIQINDAQPVDRPAARSARARRLVQLALAVQRQDLAQRTGRQRARDHALRLAAAEEEQGRDRAGSRSARRSPGSRPR